MKKLLILLALVLFSTTAEATIDSITGTIEDGETVTLNDSGNNFGSHSKGSLYVRDDFDQSSSLDSKWQAGYSAHSNGVIDVQSSITHGGSGYALRHDPHENTGGLLWQKMKFSFNQYDGSKHADGKWYISWYFRKNWVWPTTSSGTWQNFKFNRMWKTGSQSGQVNCYANLEYTENVKRVLEFAPDGTNYYGLNRDSVFPDDTWTFIQSYYWVDRDGTHVFIVDGTTEIPEWAGSGLADYGSGTTEVEMFDVGYHAVNPTSLGANDYGYMDELHIQNNTFAHIIVTDTETYADATLWVEWEWSSWASGAISVKVNRGAFAPGSTGYVHVVKDHPSTNGLIQHIDQDSGTSGNQGYEFTFGAEGGGDVNGPNVTVSPANGSLGQDLTVDVVLTAADATGVSDASYNLTVEGTLQTSNLVYSGSSTNRVATLSNSFLNLTESQVVNIDYSVCDTVGTPNCSSGSTSFTTRAPQAGDQFGVGVLNNRTNYTEDVPGDYMTAIEGANTVYKLDNTSYSSNGDLPGRDTIYNDLSLSGSEEYEIRFDARTDETLGSNGWPDFISVIGHQDLNNRWLCMWNGQPGETKIFHVSGGVRTEKAAVGATEEFLEDNDLHAYRTKFQNNTIYMYQDDNLALSYALSGSETVNGKAAFASHNDAFTLDNVEYEDLTSPTEPPDPPSPDVTISGVTFTGQGVILMEANQNLGGSLVLGQSVIAPKTALYFDGADDYAQFQLNTLVQNKTALSLVFEVLIEDMTSDNDIFAFGKHAGSMPLLIWADDDTTDHFAFVVTDNAGHTQSTTTTATTVVENVWYHIVWTFVGDDEVRMYINGVEDSNSPWSIPTVTEISQTVSEGGKVIRLGNDNLLSAGKDLKGKIREVKGYRKALSASEVAALYNGNHVSDELYIHLRFSDREGTVVTDKSGNNYHADITGATWSPE